MLELILGFFDIADASASNNVESTAAECVPFNLTADEVSDVDCKEFIDGLFGVLADDLTLNVVCKSSCDTDRLGSNLLSKV